MPKRLEQIKKIGWFVVEAALLLVVLCVLLDIIVGSNGFAFISQVASNARNFLHTVPPGTTLGIVILVFLYWFISKKK
ncbi:MAG: hypothetical protein VX923_02700 [Pseudomonadota bacterium]|nr:hypothetical protein [Pseudomonadota bacterium]